MKPVIKISATTAELSETLANDFSAMAGEYTAKGMTFRVALSGGNTPILFFEKLTAKYKESINWNNIEFYWADERCVPPDDGQSNFGMTKQFLFDNIKISESNINRIKGENNPDAEAKRYTDIVSAKLNNSGGLPQYDLILLGTGSDGHTASIFPNRLDLFSSKEIYATSSHPDSGQKRITITGNVINNAKNVWFLISGKDKAGIVKEVLSRNESSLAYPAFHVNPAGELAFYLDKDAASEV